MTLLKLYKNEESTKGTFLKSKSKKYAIKEIMPNEKEQSYRIWRDNNTFKNMSASLFPKRVIKLILGNSVI